MSSTRTRAHSHSTHRTQSTLSEDPEQVRPPRAPSPTPPEDNAPPPEQEVTKLRLGAHYAGLVWASMIGCLIRLGLEGLGEYDGKIIFQLAWAQGVGSGIMGLALARKNEIIGIYPPIYTFLTTGIAGSVTTFSSWMLEGYLAFSNFDHYDRKGLHDTVDGVAYSLSTMAIAMASLQFGEHFASVLPRLPLSWQTRKPSSDHSTTALPTKNSSSTSSASEPPHDDVSSSRNQTKFNEEKVSSSRPTGFNTLTRTATPILDIVTIFTALLAYLLVLILYFFAPRRHSWRHSVLFPLLLAPPGTILRFFLARFNTHRTFIDRFPIGTFLANMIATLIIAGTYAAQRRPSARSSSSGGGGGGVRCNALYAIQQGFCGCLSTVSTFVVEARTVKGWIWKGFYIGGSVILGHLFVLAIVGGIGWSRGFIDVCKG
ncbi:hypothetical protein IAR55_005404 [Kwoniella newhampshirensis]|uniref:Uncharacterized protein n=1 Tax=Kwoniella newhampshirensis TaxID=1651941 RepID=A0AAW0YVU1_9TREE